ncbi:hypothetical protein G7054_g6238 [Neopestalotiopsis clavispora]|nr:hypothetical protein G7054_g6238 [Neopestalotiopsis clavispora]
MNQNAATTDPMQASKISTIIVMVNEYTCGCKRREVHGPDPYDILGEHAKDVGFLRRHRFIWDATTDAEEPVPRNDPFWAAPERKGKCLDCNWFAYFKSLGDDDVLAEKQTEVITKNRLLAVRNMTREQLEAQVENYENQSQYWAAQVAQSEVQIAEINKFIVDKLVDHVYWLGAQGQEAGHMVIHLLRSIESLPDYLDRNHFIAIVAQRCGTVFTDTKISKMAFFFATQLGFGTVFWPHLRSAYQAQKEKEKEYEKKVGKSQVLLPTGVPDAGPASAADEWQQASRAFQVQTELKEAGTRMKIVNWQLELGEESFDTNFDANENI